MKKIGIAFLVCLFIMSAAGCGKNKTTGAYSGFEPKESGYSDQTSDSEKSSTGESKQSTPVLSVNQDGVVPLKKYSSNTMLLENCYEQDQQDTASYFYVLGKHANESVVKIRLSDPLAIYASYETLHFIRVDGSAAYTVPLNFADHYSEEGVDGFPERFGNQSVELGELTRPGIPIKQCNDIPLDEFFSGKSYRFYDRGLGVSCDEILFLTAEKDEEFVFGGYQGTSWITATVAATLEYYKASRNNVSTIQPQKTKNGYFSVDCASLEKGLYYVTEFDSFIEFV